MGLHVGTSGWAYPEWKPAFYPQELPRSRFLHHYSSVLNACEINATFYRLQSETTMKRWLAAAPEGFLFATKAHRRLTHSRTLPIDRYGRAFLEKFLASISMLAPHLGVVLFQFPPYRERDDAAFEQLVHSLPDSHRFAFEFRHPSWDAPEVSELAAATGGTICVAETAGAAPGELPPGPIAYVRLRADAYTEDTRAAWKALLIEHARSREVFVFAKHEGAPAGDPFSGVGLAEWLSGPC